MITSFSSAGPTAFGHDLKPDISAPGAQILSSTLPNTSSSRFAVFDGTSMASPHVAGAAALLLQLHQSWTPAQVKSALVSTAGPAWGDTARTQEAPVTLEGGGLVALPRAADPQLFTEPASLSFEDLSVPHGDASRGLLVRLSDAGDGAGTWQVQLSPQAATGGTAVDVAGTVAVPPGGEADLAVVAHANAGAPAQNYGFVVLSKGGVTRRVPYLFLVSKPRLAAATLVPLRRTQQGDTRTGVDRVDLYRYPAAPFGNNPDQPPMNEDGAETVYSTFLDRPAVNIGVSILAQTPGARIDPWYLGSLDENTVQGDAGTPVDVNGLTYDYLLPIGAAASFPRQDGFMSRVDSWALSLHGQERRRGLCPAFVGERRDAAITAAADDTRIRGTADARRAHTRHAVERRSLLARDGVSGDPRRRRRVRPLHGYCGLPAAEQRPGSACGNGRRADDLLRLPGGEEHRHGRAEHHAEHPNRFSEDARRRRHRDRLAAARPRRLRAWRGGRLPSRRARPVESLVACFDRRQAPCRLASDRPGSLDGDVFSRGKHSIIATAVGAKHRKASEARIVRVCSG